MHKIKTQNMQNNDKTKKEDNKHDTTYKCSNCDSESKNEPGMCCDKKRDLCEECVDKKCGC